MKTSIFTFLCVVLLAVYSCKKDSTSTTNTTGSDPTLEGQVLTDFSNVLVNPDYQDIQTNAGIMRDAAAAFVANPTDANLTATRTAWKNTRAAWESCEGFLFGPVEDSNYDPNMDSWPVNKVDLDSLLSSSNALAVTNINSLDNTLKGFHAIEYVIYGVGGTKKAAQITAREKTYLTSLTQSLYNTTTDLRNSWDPAVSGNFTLQVINAGKSGDHYSSRKAVFLALAGSMSGICDEVANNKMQTPLVQQDSTQDESSFSHNSVIDFTNNITGVRNAYLSTYNGSASGHNLSELVKAKNASLDNKIQSQLNAAIASFKGITTTYEKAIYTQKNQIATVQAACNTLKTTIDGDLTDFINANIKD
jgi:putative iron-regulated protein